MKHAIKLIVNSTEEDFEISEAGAIKWTTSLIEMDAVQREELIRIARITAKWLRINGGTSLEVEEIT